MTAEESDALQVREWGTAEPLNPMLCSLCRHKRVMVFFVNRAWTCQVCAKCWWQLSMDEIAVIAKCDTV